MEIRIEIKTRIEIRTEINMIRMDWKGKKYGSNGHFSSAFSHNLLSLLRETHRNTAMVQGQSTSMAVFFTTTRMKKNEKGSD